MLHLPIFRLPLDLVWYANLAFTIFAPYLPLAFTFFATYFQGANLGKSIFSSSKSFCPFCVTNWFLHSLTGIYSLLSLASKLDRRVTAAGYTLAKFFLICFSFFYTLELCIAR